MMNDGVSELTDQYMDINAAEWRLNERYNWQKGKISMNGSME